MSLASNALTPDIIKKNPLSFEDINGFALDILHKVYGEDIPIAVDPFHITDCFEITTQTAMLPLGIQSSIRFNEQDHTTTIRLCTGMLGFRQAFVVGLNLGHFFLHIVQNSTRHITTPTVQAHSHLEHGSINNPYFKTHSKERYWYQQAYWFVGSLLIPKGALEQLFAQLKVGERYLIKDLCRVFDVPNDLMRHMLHCYDLYNNAKIYDSL